MFFQNFEIMSIIVICNITAEFMYAFEKAYIAMKMNDKKMQEKYSTKKYMML